MIKVLLWNCSDDSLKVDAEKEIRHLLDLRSDNFQVTVAEPDVDLERLSFIAR